MKASDKASRMFTNAKTIVERQGDKLWSILCDNLPCDTPFTTGDAAEALTRECGFTFRTSSQYARAVLQSVYDNQDGEDRAVWRPWPGTWRI